MWDYALYLLNLLLLTAPILAGQQMLLFDCGVFSLGCAAFYGAGAYISAILSVKYGLPPMAALPAACLGSGIMALIFGLPFLRYLRGDFLAVASLGLTQATFVLLRASAPGAISGLGGVPRLHSPLAGVLTDNLDAVLIHGLFCGLCLGLIAFIRRRRLGRLATAARLDENALRVSGYSPTLIKLQIFVLASVMGGAAGALQANYLGAVEPRQAALSQSVLFLCGAVLSGNRSVLGAFLGAFFLVGVPELLQKGLTAWAGRGWQVFPAIQVLYGILLIGVAFALFPRDPKATPLDDAS